MPSARDSRADNAMSIPQAEDREQRSVERSPRMGTACLARTDDAVRPSLNTDTDQG